MNPKNFMLGGNLMVIWTEISKNSAFTSYDTTFNEYNNMLKSKSVETQQGTVKPEAIVYGLL